MQVGRQKSRFSTNISLHRVLSTLRPPSAVRTAALDGGNLVTLIGGVCVQHLSEARVAVRVTMAIAARWYAMYIQCRDIVTIEALTMANLVNVQFI